MDIFRQILDSDAALMSFLAFYVLLALWLSAKSDTLDFLAEGDSFGDADLDLDPRVD